MDRKSNFYERTVSEMIHIKELKDSLNLNSDTELLEDSYFDILNWLSINVFKNTMYLSLFVELSCENFSLSSLTLSQQEQIHFLDNCY